MPISHATLAFALVAALYTFPSFVAVAFGRRHQWGVFAVNFALGWTVVGWLASLRWALAKSRPRSPRQRRRSRAFAAARAVDRDASLERARMEESWADAATAPDLYAQWLDEGTVRRERAPTSPPLAAKADMPRKALPARKSPHPISANRETPTSKAA